MLAEVEANLWKISCINFVTLKGKFFIEMIIREIIGKTNGNIIYDNEKF